ncbi:MAG: exodeoxyribonuclease VII small subunit [Acidimicrobiia bacterium]|nr:exodeoxyribonuclease VII small subunit [Acidimicrobiia bacterium]
MAEDPKPATFESDLSELESVVNRLESGDLPLEESLQLFEKGMALSESCRQRLEQAETKIEILLKKGNRVSPAPFQPEQG